MIFIDLCTSYIEKHPALFYTYILIATLSFLIKILVTPMIYSKITNIADTNFAHILKDIASLWVIIGIVYIIKVRIENKLFPEFLSFVRTSLFRNFIEKNKTNFNDSSVTADITRILEVTRYMKDIFAWFSQYIIPMVIMMAIMSAYFIKKIPVLGAMNVVCSTIICTFSMYRAPQLITSSNRRESQYMEMVTKLDENFSNLMNIYLNNQIKETIEENDNIEKSYITTYKTQNREVEQFTTSIKLINYFFAFLSLFYLYKKMDGQNRQEFITVLLIFTFYISTMENIAEDAPCYIMLIGNLKNAEPFLEKAQFTERETYPLEKFYGNIDVERISFKYKDNYVFNDYSFALRQGQRIGIVGKAGSGKSTLMKLLLHFYNVEKGAIYLDGKDITTLHVDDIRRHINYINQKTTLFNDTIVNNMKYGMDHITDEMVLAFLQKYDLLSIFHPDLNRPMDCLQVMIEKNGANMSLGMQKVIFLIRGILRDSSMYIFDEPFTSIDKDTRECVLNMIDAETRGKTIIVITHDTEGLDAVLDDIVELSE